MLAPTTPRPTVAITSKSGRGRRRVKPSTPKRAILCSGSRSAGGSPRPGHKRAHDRRHRQRQRDRLSGPGSCKRLRFRDSRPVRAQSAHTDRDLVTRSQFPPLTNAEAVEIAQVVIELCGGEDIDPRDEARQWIREFITGAGAVVDALDQSGEAKSKWAVLDACVQAEHELRANRDAAARWR